MGEYLVPNWLSRRARVQPDHPAVCVDGRALSYSVLAQRAAVARERLIALGVRRGDPVAVLLPNGLAFVEVMYGLMGCGGVLVPIDTRLSPTEVAHRAADCGARWLLTDAELRDRIAAQVAAPTHVWECSPGQEKRAGCETPRIPRIDLDGVQSIVYTSGTGGDPRGVRLTYANHWWSAIGSALNLGVQADDRWLVCLPLCHVGGLSILLRSLIYGTTAVIHERFDAVRINRAIEEDRITIISLVATMLQRMLAEHGTRSYPPWLRCVLVGGGPVPLPLLEECAARGLPVAQTYGLTEAASQVTTLAPHDAVRKLGSAGQPLLPTEVIIAGEEAPAPPGVVGEILVRGPTVTTHPDTRNEPIVHKDGWLHTGDLGRLDEEGYLYVVGRSDDVIVSGGENIHPAEIEAALHAHPAVAEACVVGIPHAEWGMEVIAYVRLREGLRMSEQELREQTRRSLAGFKVPRRVIFVDDFPRTAAGKINRQALRQRLC